jgi:hypothetical protein
MTGNSRDRIAANNQIGAGTVSNIINEWKKGVEDSDYDSVRELTVSLKKQGIGMSTLACSVRLYNYIINIGANEDNIESFIINLANSPEPEKLIDVANQIAHLSRSESIPLEGMEGHVKQKEEEKQMLEEEIKQRCAILESTNVEIQTINEYKQLEAELSRHHHSSEDPGKLLTVLNNLRQYRYDPKKIVAEFSNIQSLKRRQKALQDNCAILEKRMSEDRQVLPLLQRIRSMGIGMDELLPFSLAVKILDQLICSKFRINSATFIEIPNSFTDHLFINSANPSRCRFSIFSNLSTR